eukprot:525667_1
MLTSSLLSSKERQEEQKHSYESNQMTTSIADSTTPPDKNRWEVGLKFDIHEITYIDTHDQKYGIKGLLTLTWKPNKPDDKFEPFISFANNVDKTELNQEKETTERIIQNEKYKVKKIDINMTFTEEFEVSAFPFDVQDLTIVMKQDKKSSEIVHVPSHKDNNYMRIDETWSSVTNWTIVKTDACKVVMKKKSSTESSKQGKTYELIMFRIQVRRKWEGIVHRLILWLLFLGIMSWATFAVNSADIGDRLSYSITMALTIVAFQFIISNELPRVSYLTLLDKYNLFIFTFVLLITMETTIVGYNGEGLLLESETIDDYAAIIALVLFVAGNILFLIYAMYLNKCELEKIGRWTTYNPQIRYVPKTANGGKFYERHAKTKTTYDT